MIEYLVCARQLRDLQTCNSLLNGAFPVLEFGLGPKAMCPVNFIFIHLFLIKIFLTVP